MSTNVLYHFTSNYHLPAILKAGRLTLTTSNFSLDNFGLFPVVWLTCLPVPDNMGLLFDPNIPDAFNKTRIRCTIRKEPYMEQWDEWSDRKGMDKELKRVLIESAHAIETYKTWYVSEREIPLEDVVLIEDMKSGHRFFEVGDFEGL